MIGAQFSFVLILAEAISAAVIAWRAICEINRMRRTTWWPIAVAWVFVGAFASGVLAQIIAADPAMPECTALLISAVAFLISVDRRRGHR